MSEAPSRYTEFLEQPQTLVEFLVEKDQEIAKLQRHLYQLQKGHLFGSKSEKLSLISDAQLSLLPNQEVEAPKVEPAKIVIPAHTRAARVQKDLSKLPHNRIVHEPESTRCSCCSEAMSKIGEDISKELEHQPAKLFVNVHVRPRYACNKCKEGSVVQAELPLSAKPLERSIVGSGLLSQIIVSKYVDHLPLHRQQQMFARYGFEIPRRNMCDWISAADDTYLTRLWSALKNELLSESYLQADETTLKVQDNQTPGECHTGYLWGAYSIEKKLVLFEYAESRAGAVAKEIFKDFEGTLQTDLYAGYNPVLLPERVLRIACLAHVRRKFIECEKSCSKETTAILSLIARLYQFEQQFKGLDPPKRKAKREQHSKPILLELEVYLRALTTRTLPKAPLMEAINYTLKQWQEIMRILDDGRYQLDNNPIEREMRPIAIGRKNYLFAGSHDGARRAAVIYSLLGTAKLHKVNPYDWLKDVFQRMRAHPVNRVAELLPHNWINPQR